MRYSQLALLLLTGFFLVFSASNAVLAEDTALDADGKRLEALLTKRIDKTKASLQELDKKLITTGKLHIEKTDTYYAATLPAFKIELDEKDMLNIGLIAINATPIKDSTDWKMSVALPMPIYFDSKEGERLGQIDLGSQQMGGIYSDKLDGFKKLDAIYNNIKYADFQSSTRINIGSVKLSNDYAINKAGLLSGPSTFLLKNIAITPQKNDLMFQIESMDVNAIVKNYDPALKDKTQQTLLDTSSDKMLDNNFASTIVDLLKSSGNSEVKAFIKNISAKDKKTKENAFNINNLSLANTTSMSGDNRFGQTYSLKYDGLSFGKKEEFDDFIPSSLKTGLELKNIPIQSILKESEKVTSIDSKNTEAKKKASDAFKTNLIQLFKSANTVVKLNDTSIKNDLYHIDTKGDLRASTKSPLGAVGNLTLSFTGLEQTMEKLKSSAIGKQALPQLAIFQMISEKKGDKNIAVLELGENGSIMINGKDMSAMSGLLGG